MKDAKICLGLILLCSLLWAAACSMRTVAKSTATLTPAEQEEQDPMFGAIEGLPMALAVNPGVSLDNLPLTP